MKSLALMTAIGLALIGMACSDGSKSDQLKPKQTKQSRPVLENVPEGRVLVTFYDDQLLWSTFELNAVGKGKADTANRSHIRGTMFSFPGRWAYSGDGVPKKPMQHVMEYPTGKPDDEYFVQVKMRNFWSRFTGLKTPYVRMQPFGSKCDNRIVKLAVWEKIEEQPAILSPAQAWAELWRSEADLLEGKPLPPCEEPPQR